MNRTLDILAIGSCYVDINLANYPFSESGIPTEIELVGSEYETVPGGSAVNFCLLLQRLGLRTAFVGMAGTDTNGDLLAGLLQEGGVEPLLVRSSDILTNISFNMTNPQGKHIILVAGTANAALSPTTVLPRLEEFITQTSMLYLGGCFKLTSLVHAFPQITEAARRQRTLLAVDHGRIPEGTSEEMLDAVKSLILEADYYFPSHDEFLKLWKAASIKDGLRTLHEQTPKLLTAVKDGANGAYYWADGAMRHVPTLKVDKVLNVTGAGDSFNAGVIAAHRKGLAYADALAYGCRVAAAKIKAEAPPLLRP